MVAQVVSSEVNGRARDMRCINLRDAWHEMRRVRTAIEEHFAGAPAELRHGAILTARELAENVIEHSDEPASAAVTMTIEDGHIVISTLNRVKSPKHAHAVRERIQQIAGSEARDLYITRMLEIMQNPRAHEVGMGLLRIAYEGGFQLSCELLGERLHIQARRKL